MTDVIEYLYVMTPDLVQKISVVSSGAGVSNALVKIYKLVGTENELVYSAFTDGNGIVSVNIDDGNTYTFVVEKDGYTDYSKSIYIPTGNTETIQLNIESESSLYGSTLFTSNCKSKLTSEKDCYFKAVAYQDIANITIKVNLNNTITYKQCLNTDYCKTNDYTINNISKPINASLYFDGTLIQPIIYINFTDLSNRSRQITFPTATIKSSTNYLILFYFMTLIMGIFIAVSIENKVHGWGLFAFMIWLLIIAQTGFWEYYLVIIPIVTILIGKLYYTWIK